MRAPSRSEDWQELWNTLDEDGGGTLDKAEVGVLLELIGRGGAGRRRDDGRARYGALEDFAGFDDRRARDLEI